MTSWLILAACCLPALAFVLSSRKRNKLQLEIAKAELLLEKLKGQISSLYETRRIYQDAWPPALVIEDMEQLVSLLATRLQNFKSVLETRKWGPFDKRFDGIQNVISTIFQTRDLIRDNVTDITTDMLTRDAMKNAGVA